MKWQIYPPVVASSGQEWQFHISTVRGHIGRSSGRCGQHGSFTILLLEFILADQVADLVKNGNFTFLLLELILADQVADLPPPLKCSRHHGKIFFYLINIILLWDVFGSHFGFCI